MTFEHAEDCALAINSRHGCSCVTRETVERAAEALYAAKYPKQAHCWRSTHERTRKEYRLMAERALGAASCFCCTDSSGHGVHTCHEGHDCKNEACEWCGHRLGVHHA